MQTTRDGCQTGLSRWLAEELRQVVNFDAIALFLYDEKEKHIQNAVLEALSRRGRRQ